MRTVRCPRARLVVLWLASLALAGAMIGHAKAETLKLSHIRPAESQVDNDLRGLGSEVSKSTGITLQRFPNSTLGDYTVVERLVSDGSVDMALQPAFSSKDTRFDISSLPFFVTDWEDAKRKFGPTGPVRKAIEELYEQQGIRVLAVYPQFFGGISLQQNPQVVNKADIKVRVPKGKAYFAQALGYAPVELPWSETKKNFEQGTVNGASGSGAEGYFSSLLPHTKYYVVANTHFEVWYLLMNQRRYDGLSKAQKDAFQRAATYFEAQRWSKAEVSQSFYELRLRNHGVTIIRPTRQEAERIAAEVRKTVWPAIFDLIGRPYAEKVVGGL